MLRIGEVARRTGTTTDVLRAWERRYGLLRPQRGAGGFRLYVDADVERVRVMQAHLKRGVAAAEAARLALADETPRPNDSLLDALLALDEPRAQAALDVAFARWTEEAVLRDVVLPALRGVGELWARGEATVAQEHFASNLLRGRLLALARRWDQGVGPRALLACPPGELHDLPLIVFGLALRRQGWRVLFLGADTPYDVIAATAAEQRPDLVVLSSSQERSALAHAPLDALAAVSRLALAGRWPAAPDGVLALDGDPVEAAAAVAAAT